MVADPHRRTGRLQGGQWRFGFGEMTQTVNEGSEMAVPLNDEGDVIAREYIPQAFKFKPRQEWIDLFRAQTLRHCRCCGPGGARGRAGGRTPTVC